MRGRGIVGAKEVERRGDPLIEEALDHFGGHFARLHNAQQAVVAGAEVIRLLLEHRSHGARQRIERRDGEHLELELAVAVDELRVREEVEPVVDDLIEGAEQPLAFIGAALEQLRRFALPFVAEM